MPKQPSIFFDPLKCSGCGICLPSCPADSIDFSAGKAGPRGNLCIRCGHCQAICPENAISGAHLSPHCSSFETFSADCRALPPGEFNLASLVRLMASRRSIRRFKPGRVDPAILRDLIRIGIQAPTTTNCQRWTFSIIPDDSGVRHLSRQIATVYRRICRLSKWRSLRTLLNWLGKPDLENFHRFYRSFIINRLNEFDKGGRDPFFHGAPAALLVGTRAGKTSHSEDVHLATQNILLTAHAMGLGTCLVGLALVAFRNDSTISTELGIPANETIHSAIGIGYPDEKYYRLTGRAEPEVRILSTPNLK